MRRICFSPSTAFTWIYCLLAHHIILKKRTLPNLNVVFRVDTLAPCPVEAMVSELPLDQAVKLGTFYIFHFLVVEYALSREFSAAPVLDEMW